MTNKQIGNGYQSTVFRIYIPIDVFVNHVTPNLLYWLIHSDLSITDKTLGLQSTGILL
jgi:hypothetical protein